MPYVTMVRDGITPSVIPGFNQMYHNFIVGSKWIDIFVCTGLPDVHRTTDMVYPTLLSANSCGTCGKTQLLLISTFFCFYLFFLLVYRLCG